MRVLMFPAVVAIVSLIALQVASAEITEESFLVSSILGGAGDSVQGGRILSDGTMVLAANVSEGPLAAAEGDPEKKGMIIHLSADGKLVDATRVGAQVRDLAIDAGNHLYVALGSEGLAKLSPDAKTVIWSQTTDLPCSRIDATEDGTCVALSYTKEDDSATGPGSIRVFTAEGQELSNVGGRHNTLDVAIDGATKTVVSIGWKQAKAWEGRRKLPVQIAHLTGRDYKGEVKYHLYDWPTDVDDPAFLNKPTNNMADTRGYRCSIGADGKVHAVFEAAGGNHIFRWEPVLTNDEWVTAKQKIAKVDQYHAFHRSKAEHKTMICIFDPGTGEYLNGQQFTTRLSDGRANAARVKNGAVAGGADGATYVGGYAASGLPASFIPPQTGEETSGAFLLGMNPELSKRLFCVRFQSGSGAETNTVDVREINGRKIALVGGRTSKNPGDFWIKNPLQTEAPPRCGFFAVLSLD